MTAGDWLTFAGVLITSLIVGSIATGAILALRWLWRSGRR